VVFFEYALDVAEACRARGIATVAVTTGEICPEPRREFFATTHEADFGWLRQKSYREAKERSALERLLGAALRGGELREATSADSPADEGWTAVTKSFPVRRGQG